MDYPKSNPTVGLKDGKFTDGDPVTGEKASRDKAIHQNMLYDELIGVIQHAGLTPSDADHTQIVKALKSAFGRPKLLWEQTTVGQVTPQTQIIIDGINSDTDKFYFLEYTFKCFYDPPSPYEFIIYPNGNYPSNEYRSQRIIADQTSLTAENINDPVFCKITNATRMHGVMRIGVPEGGGLSVMSDCHHTLGSVAAANQKAYISSTEGPSLVNITSLTIESKAKPLILNFQGRLFGTDVAL